MWNWIDSGTVAERCNQMEVKLLQVLEKKKKNIYKQTIDLLKIRR